MQWLRYDRYRWHPAPAGGCTEHALLTYPPRTYLPPSTYLPTV